MCGIFGICLDQSSNLAPHELKRVLHDLFLLSESRGKEAAGLAVMFENSIQVIKRNRPASEFMRSPEYGQLIDRALTHAAGNTGQDHAALTFIGHSRLVTDGTEQSHRNNQPVVLDRCVGVHNGIIVNVARLWREQPSLKRRSEVDSEVIFALVQKFLQEGQGLPAATRQTFHLLEGMASIAGLFADLDCLLLASNNESLYYYRAPETPLLLFASERFILEKIVARYCGPQTNRAGGQVIRVDANTGRIVDLHGVRVREIGLNGNDSAGEEPQPTSGRTRSVEDVTPDKIEPAPRKAPTLVIAPEFIKEFDKIRDDVDHLRRCTKCILPESFPYIEFDADSVCNYCRNYQPMAWKGRQALEEHLVPYRRSGGQPECIVAISGGRDSCYCLHYMTRELGVKPITYTYDWGMVTDLARRNISRMCGKLGVENVLVSANIPHKRANIRKNVSAWLRRPNLGTVPLFMAGDKQFFYYVNRLKKQTGIRLDIWSGNPLERTDFKSGFCDIKRKQLGEKYYNLKWMDKARLAWFYGKEFLLNPRYLNSSLLDSMGAFASYYFIPHELILFYSYLPWIEQDIERTLIDEYDWELAQDTKSSWRIGDGTAPFYNYIYYAMAGLSENDTFRSNQIREGAITRDKALELARRDNEPRYDSIRWYLDVIGLDFDEVLRTILRAPKVYQVS